MSYSIPKISVIVAAYNAGKFLARCLDSIVSQTLDDWECIIVNDGSTDMTGTIADEYAERDQRIKVIHQNNGGVARARQAGLDTASGIYSIHIDSDDWIEPEMFWEMYCLAEKKDADVVICDFVIDYPDGRHEYQSQRPASLAHYSVLGQTFYELFGSLCNKLIKMSCYREHDIRFIPGINFGEDQLVVLRLLYQNLVVVHIARGFYHYDHTQNEGSAMYTHYSHAARLQPLEEFEKLCDVAPVREAYDKALFQIAYSSLFEKDPTLFGYRKAFRKHIPSFSRVKGFPFYTKWLVYLRLVGVRIPLNQLKKIIQR